MQRLDAVLRDVGQSGELSVQGFLGSKWRNAWIRGDGVSVYVRRGRRTLRTRPGLLTVFDIAHVLADVPRQGFFTRWLDETTPLIESSGEFSGIYIENIGEDYFYDFFIKRGYFNSGKIGDERSLYFMFGDKHDAVDNERSPS